MKKIVFIIGLCFCILFPSMLFAKDVHVRGYYRKDGTYVRPHIRSSPDSSKANNYGPSTSDEQLMNPRLRDKDNDGIPNNQDKDDDNDGILDDNDARQYSPDDEEDE